MRVLYLHQYFNTPGMPGGTRSYEMARRLVDAGHEVHMITSHREGAPPTKDRWWTTHEDGITVHWTANEYSNLQGFSRRIGAFARFAWISAERATEIPADVIFATSTPLTIAIPALYASARQGIPMVFEVRDLWPEAPIQLGALKNPLLIKAARQLERTAYRRSKHVVALSPGMLEGVVATGVPREKVSLIPNASDLELFHPGVDGSEFRRTLELGDRFTLAYFGTMGYANGLDFVLDGAAELMRRGEGEIRLVLHGDGYERAALMSRAEREGLTNVVFSPPVGPKESVAQLARAADVCMTIYRNVPVLATCSPNKMFDSLAAGRPVLTNMPGWLQEIVEKERCGVFVRPDDPGDFADKVLSLRDNPALRAQFATNARRVAEERFNRDTLAAELEQILLAACKERST